MVLVLAHLLQVPLPQVLPVQFLLPQVLLLLRHQLLVLLDQLNLLAGHRELYMKIFTSVGSQVKKKYLQVLTIQISCLLIFSCMTRN
jgi:hypothetical protein